VELRQLRYFVRIVEAGSLSRASQSLHVAQPALSQQVSRLEQELGVQLLSRSVRGVTPTDAGQAVYQHARRVLQQIDATPQVALAGAGSGPSGRVAVGLPWTVTALLGMPLLRSIRQAYPAIRLDITEESSLALEQQLAQGRLDLAVVFGQGADAGLQLRPLVQEPLRLAGARGSLPGGAPRTLEEVARLPLLVLGRIREEIEQALAPLGIQPRVVAEINAPGLLNEALHAGLGFSILPSCALEGPLRAGLIDVADIVGLPVRRTLYLGTSRLYPPAPAAAFVLADVRRLVREAVADGRWNAEWIGGDENDGDDRDGGVPPAA